MEPEKTTSRRRRILGLLVGGLVFGGLQYLFISPHGWYALTRAVISAIIWVAFMAVFLRYLVRAKDGALLDYFARRRSERLRRR